MLYSFNKSNILTLKILNNLILIYIQYNYNIIKIFINIFVNIFYNLDRATNFYINIHLKMITKKKIIKYNLIIIYLKSLNIILKI